MANWIETMNRSFLGDADAERVWNEAKRLYFFMDKPIDTAFTTALRWNGFTVEDIDG